MSFVDHYEYVDDDYDDDCGDGDDEDDWMNLLKFLLVELEVNSDDVNDNGADDSDDELFNFIYFNFTS